MIGEEMRETLKELTLEEMRKRTWDYAQEDIFGLYEDNIIRGFLWQVKECGDVHPLSILRCNVAEGWVEHLEYDVLPDTQICLEFFKSAKIKRDEKTGEPVRTKVSCKVEVELLTATGEIIVTLS